MPDIEMPWSNPSRSVEGRKTEKRIVKKRGGRVTPMSGAGRIKDDGISDTEVFEVKDADRSHSIKATDVLALFKRATRQGKDASYIVYFKSVDLTLTCKITKGKG